MTTSLPIDRLANHTTPSTTRICLTLHLVAYLLVTCPTWFLTSGTRDILMMLPVAQCALIAIWAATSSAHNALRFAGAIAVGVAAWISLSRISVMGFSATGSAWAGVLLSVQLISTLFAVYTIKCLGIGVPLQKDENNATESPERFSFRLQTLILWTVVFAMVFAILRITQGHWGWMSAPQTQKLWLPIVIIGFSEMLIPTALYYSLAPHNWTRRGLRFFVAIPLALVALLGINRCLEWSYPGTVFLPPGRALMLTAIKGAIIAITLLLCRRPAISSLRLQTANL
ncbi:hypothetical protein NHH03_09720 [Stieleria sp. TO1_6]|uniref:hypothetical protein n=1 Tax=Stieleria tagensis TaxID=2956795 RepID=UPI00209B35AC|nr:hypothetical protein [Stieleria tagensis]MCO8122014.1 hypothetical protein [Stieleria tagensis]